jgi:SAM-dependent methyltransferase
MPQTCWTHLGVMNKTMRDIFLKLLLRSDSILRKWIHQLRKGGAEIPVGEVCFGDLRRLHPFTNDFGFSRGGAVDRYYIEEFLQKNASVIRGHSLELKDDRYTRKFGGDRVTKREILDIDAGNSRATIISDLTKDEVMPSDSFDCVVLTQVLQYIYDFRAALKTIHRILKPGGVLLVTVPGISQIDWEYAGETWHWFFTQTSLQRTLADIFGKDIQVEHHGNVLVATGFLYGLSRNEIKKEEYDFNDPHYQVIITGKAVKSS